MKKLLTIAIAGFLVWGYAVRHRDTTRFEDSGDAEHGEVERADAEQAERSLPTFPATVTPASFSCDGRTYCSQMKSCDEAKYFLQHCLNVKMDGDHDGVPCEQQWCPN